MMEFDEELTRRCGDCLPPGYSTDFFHLVAQSLLCAVFTSKSIAFLKIPMDPRLRDAKGRNVYRSFDIRRFLTILSVRPTHPPLVSPRLYRMCLFSLPAHLGTSSSKWLITPDATAQLDACEDLNTEASSLLNGFRLKTKRTVLHQVCHI